MSASSFLPEGYEVPKSGGRYTKLKAGESVKLRILSSPILGYERWTNDNNPIRWRMNEQEPQRNDWKIKDKAKHFWAMVVWNRTSEQIEIWQVSQITIQEAIQNLIKNEDWGNPKEYDITVTRTDKSDKVTYSVVPSNLRPVENGVIDNLHEMTIDLQKLFTGDDPFAA